MGLLVKMLMRLCVLEICVDLCFSLPHCVCTKTSGQLKKLCSNSEFETKYVLNDCTLNYFYNPNSGNVGTFFFFFLIKWKLKDFQITWANILFTWEQREHNKCYRNYLLLSTKWAHFKFDACYSSQKSWHGGNKGLQKTFWKDSAGRTTSN